MVNGGADAVPVRVALLFQCSSSTLPSQSLQERLASTEVERDRLSALVHEMNETLSGSEQKRLSEQQAHLEVLKGAKGEAARLRDRVQELAAELSVSQDQCEVGEHHTSNVQCNFSVYWHLRTLLVKAFTVVLFCCV